MNIKITKEDMKFWKKLDSKCDDEIIAKELLRLKKEAQKELLEELNQIGINQTDSDIRVEIIKRLTLYKQLK